MPPWRPRALQLTQFPTLALLEAPTFAAYVAASTALAEDGSLVPIPLFLAILLMSSHRYPLASLFSFHPLLTLNLIIFHFPTLPKALALVPIHRRHPPFLVPIKQYRPHSSVLACQPLLPTKSPRTCRLLSTLASIKSCHPSFPPILTLTHYPLSPFNILQSRLSYPLFVTLPHIIL